MNFYPILYQTPMVQGIIDERKSQTRRTKGLKVINENPNDFDFDRLQIYPDGKLRAVFFYSDEAVSVKAPYGKVGDILWVRETFIKIFVDNEFEGSREEFAYKASFDEAEKNMAT